MLELCVNELVSYRYKTINTNKNIWFNNELKELKFKKEISYERDVLTNEANMWDEYVLVKNE